MLSALNVTVFLIYQFRIAECLTLRGSASFKLRKHARRAYLIEVIVLNAVSGNMT